MLLVDGFWIYWFDFENVDVKVLLFGKLLVESFKVKVQDGFVVNVVVIDIMIVLFVMGDFIVFLIEDYRLVGFGVIGLQGVVMVWFVVFMQVQGIFGIFDLMVDGYWYYQFDLLSVVVQVLLLGDDVMDSFVVVIVDGVGLGIVIIYIDGIFDFMIFGGD